MNVVMQDCVFQSVAMQLKKVVSVQLTVVNTVIADNCQLPTENFNKTRMKNP